MVGGWWGLWLSCAPEAPTARAIVIEDLSQTIGGSKAVGAPGDLLLENDRVRFVVLGARNSLGPGLFGGSLVDADLQRGDPRTTGGAGKDAFAELIPTANLMVPAPGQLDALGVPQGGVTIVADGADGGAAIVRAEGPAAPFLTVLDALWAILGAPDLWLTTDYVLAPGKPYVEIVTTVRYGDASLTPVPLEARAYTTSFPLLDYAMTSGVVLGDFYLSGGSVDVFAPEIGFDEDGAVFEAMNSGRNLFEDPFAFPYIAGSADGVSYLLQTATGAPLHVPLFTASQTVAVGAAHEGTDPSSSVRFAPGTTISYTRRLFVGDGDVGSALSAAVESNGEPFGTLSGFVVEEGSGNPLSDLTVAVYEAGSGKPVATYATDGAWNDVDVDGSFRGSLPVGIWDVVVHDQGRGTSRRTQVDVVAGQETQVQLVAARAGALSVHVTDETGASVPAKVTVLRLGESRADPLLGDAVLTENIEGVAFSPDGHAVIDVAPGLYQVVASRGLEYEIDVSAPVEIDAQVGAKVDLQVRRSVESSGWISADFHVHAIPSHDSGVTLADRVLTMVAEGVEFFASTDHDHVTDYAPVIEAMGLESWVQSAVGVETTTVEVGHFLAFPLHHDHLGEGGATRELLDWTGLGPDDLIGNLRELGEMAGTDPLVFVAHPRDGILGYFDQYGFDPFGGIPGTAGNVGVADNGIPLFSATNPVIAANPMSWDFDALELLNGKRFDLIRTPTQSEMDDAAQGRAHIHDFFVRTAKEEVALLDGTETFGVGPQGQVDDWFALLNLGFRFTALGNSDTHGTTSVEAGCPRNYVLVGADDPASLDDQQVAEAVRAGRVVASYGPFIQLLGNGEPIGTTLTGTGPVSLDIEVQAPTWVPVDRVEVYENGVLIEDYDVPPTGDALRFAAVITVEPERDSWYVVVANGDGDMGPVFTPVEIPYIDLQTVVEEALAGVPGVGSLITPSAPYPTAYAIPSYAITNPIWVDRDGDGFDAPGIPAWGE